MNKDKSLPDWMKGKHDTAFHSSINAATRESVEHATRTVGQSLKPQIKQAKEEDFKEINKTITHFLKQGHRDGKLESSTFSK